MRVLVGITGWSLVARALVGCGGGDVAPVDATADLGVIDAARDAGPDAGDGAADASTPADVGSEEDVLVRFTPDASSPREAITAPADTWTWVPFPDSACGNGAPTGIGVNLHPGSHRLLIFMQGGGGCWDALTCYGARTAANLASGYGASDFASESAGLSSLMFYDRSAARNPWRDANLVYVPYCTGDIHGGDRIVEYVWAGQHHVTFHVGARNLDAFLARLTLTFPSVDRVTLSGASAGGFGAGLNWERVANAFPRARVDLIDDSGPPIRPPDARWLAIRDGWNLQFPAGCAGCRDNLEELFTYYGTRFPPPARLALLSYTNDPTISTYFGITTDQFRTELLDVAHRRIDPIANAHVFVAEGTSHVLLTGLATLRGPGGVALLDWLTQMDSDDAAWTSVRP